VAACGELLMASVSGERRCPKLAKLSAVVIVTCSPWQDEPPTTTPDNERRTF
jgi:hypothetical protein